MHFTDNGIVIFYPLIAPVPAGILRGKMTGSDAYHPLGLAALEQRLSDELELLELPAKPWLVPRHPEQQVKDVVILGAGLCGLTAAAALKLQGIDNVLCLDKCLAGREGPWLNYARMETLRTRKQAAGPALGIASLTFRAWFEACYGRQAWQEMTLIPRQCWMEYLVWYRRVLALPVMNQTTVTRVELRPDGPLVIHWRSPTEQGQLLARRVVIATGLDGLGAPSLPALAAGLPASLIAHSADDIDMPALAGKRVAVVGAGASAMDNAAAALEAGAERVDIFIRRDDIPRVDKFTGIGSQGMVQGYVGLPDDLKWTLMFEGEQAQIPPPRHSVLRVSRHARAFFHLSSPLQSLTARPARLEVVTPKGQWSVDFLIFATGFSIDFAARPEFAELSAKLRRWQQSYQPPADQQHAGLADSPYLGDHFELLPRPGCEATDAAISNVYCFAYPSVLSHGKLTSGIPSISDGAHRLARGIVRSLFVEDRHYHLDRFRAFDTPELLGDEWTDADQQQESFSV